jgi:hypothetical protein
MSTVVLLGLLQSRILSNFGEIEDEHDSDETLIEKELGDDTYLFLLDLM